MFGIERNFTRTPGKARTSKASSRAFFFIFPSFAQVIREHWCVFLFCLNIFRSFCLAFA